VVGRRGYGEVAAVHTVSYARHLADDTYDVTQWTNVFVTSGDYYTISHPASHNIYSTCEDSEAVNGVINNGKDGNFRVDIPLYSSRAFVHRGKMKGDDTAVEIVDRLTELTLAPCKGFPKDIKERDKVVADVLTVKDSRIYVLYQSRFYEMELSDGLLKIAPGTGEGVGFDKFLSPDNLRGVSYYYGSPYSNEYYKAPDNVFRNAMVVLIARSVGGTSAFMHYIPEMLTQGSDQAQLFIYARSPENFHLKGSGLGKEVGYVLYHQDLFKPESRKD
jgi:hypothetical protein